jgi:hypothetical protein
MVFWRLPYPTDVKVLERNSRHSLYTNFKHSIAISLPESKLASLHCICCTCTPPDVSQWIFCLYRSVEAEGIRLLERMALVHDIAAFRPLACLYLGLYFKIITACI